MKKGKANVIIDGQWGSTGKGKLIGYLALKHEINAATCDFMSNAGHTFVDDEGKTIVTCQLPTSLVNSDAMLFINAGAAITLERLFQEIEENNVSGRLVIHPHAAIITNKDREHEAEVLLRISSTLKGCGGTLSRKVMRVARLAKDEPKLQQFIGDTTTMTHTILRSGGTILVEGAQGFDLSINHGHEYPYTTSRDITTMSILNNAGIPPYYLGDVYGCLRTYPIRVGNILDYKGKRIGYSGPWHADHDEVSWDYVGANSGMRQELWPSLVEKTTVTGKVRRVFTFSQTQVHQFIDMCAPSKLFVNFINHINVVDEKKRAMSELSRKSLDWITRFQDQLINKYCGSVRSVPVPTVSHIGTGPRNCDMVEV